MSGCYELDDLLEGDSMEESDGFFADMLALGLASRPLRRARKQSGDGL